jgi:hypothetical protein
VVGPLLALGVAAGLAWATAGLVRPRRVDIRSFDPDEVARREAAMWRAYYDHRALPFFAEIARLMRSQFGLGPARAALLAGLAVRAAVVFQGGHERADYVRALPLLRRYYAILRRASEVPFDPDRAAALELEWWIVHRDAARLPVGSLAEVGAEVYQAPVGELAEHGRHRAAAATVRDQLAASGTLGEQDWQRIEQELRSAWRSLRSAV